MDLRQIHREYVWSFAQTSLKVKVNFRSLHAVYVWKNIVALVLVTVSRLVMVCRLLRQIANCQVVANS